MRNTQPSSWNQLIRKIVTALLFKLDMYKIAYLIYVMRIQKMYKCLIKERHTVRYLSGKGKKND